MPRFFFNFSGGGSDELDDVGCDFASVETAFVEAYRGMVDIGAEMLLAHEDPTALAVEIVAETGEVVMHLTYDEVLRRNVPRPGTGIDRSFHERLATLRSQMENSRRLSREVACAFETVKTTLEHTRIMLCRARLQTEAAQRQGW